MSAYAKEIKKIIIGIKAHEAEKVDKLDQVMTHIAQNGTDQEILESINEVEKFLFEELLNYDVVGKGKTA